MTTRQKPAPLKIEHVDPSTLLPDPENPRKITAKARAGLRRDLEEFGLVLPLLARRSDKVLIGGHQKHDIILKDKTSQGKPFLELYATVPVVFLDLDGSKAKALNIALNNPEIQGQWDMGLLQRMVRQIDSAGADATLTGFDDAQITRIFNWNEEPKKPREEDESDPLPLPDEGKEKSELHQIYHLGRHRLICGDAQDSAIWEALLENRQADLLWTDPPYGVDYEGKTTARKRITNDNLKPEQLTNLIRNAMNRARAYTKKGAVWYVAAPGGPLNFCTATVLNELKVWRQTIQWVKDALVLSRSDYHYRNEPIFMGENYVDPERLEKRRGPARATPIHYGWNPGAAHHFVRDRTQDTIWEVPRPKRSEEHPTMKPVELIRRAIRNSTDPGAIVVDCFAGSGSTLIACEQTGRTAYMIELDPAYCDVIRRRHALYMGEAK